MIAIDLIFFTATYSYPPEYTWNGYYPADWVSDTTLYVLHYIYFLVHRFHGIAKFFFRDPITNRGCRQIQNVFGDIFSFYYFAAFTKILQ